MSKISVLFSLYVHRNNNNFLHDKNYLVLLKFPKLDALSAILDTRLTIPYNNLGKAGLIVNLFSVNNRRKGIRLLDPEARSHIFIARHINSVSTALEKLCRLGLVIKQKI